MDSVHNSKSETVRVLVAGSSRMHTQLLSDALKRDPTLQVVNWNCDSSSLIPSVLAHKVDVIAISSTLDGDSTQGLEVVRQLRTVSPHTKAVVLLDSQHDQAVIGALRAGARGIFSRDSSVDLLSKCIHNVHQGEIWVDSQCVALAIEALASAPVLRPVGAGGLNLLSKRELEVVQCLVRGLTNREIEDRLGLSHHTVKNYLFRIFDKLGVSSRVELMFLALSQNANAGDAGASEIPENLLDGGLTDSATLASLKNKAEKGSPAAQLALAQSYLSRRSQPDDLVEAYTWFLIASERTSQARSLVTRMLTSKQLDDAQQKASQWLAQSESSGAPRDDRKGGFAVKKPGSEDIAWIETNWEDPAEEPLFKFGLLGGLTHLALAIAVRIARDRWTDTDDKRYSAAVKKMIFEWADEIGKLPKALAGAKPALASRKRNRKVC